MTTLLELENLSVTLPGANGAVVPIIHDASLHIGEGEIVGLAGESGSGKSMTASALLGLLPPGAVTGGRATLAGAGSAAPTELLSLRGKEWNSVRGAQIAMVFQDSTASLHPMLTIGRQLTEHMRVHLGVDRKAANARAAELLDRVRIPDPVRALKAYPHQFSGGMRQRVAIASALACNPRLLIADEPTTALDVTVQAGILRLLDELRRESGLSVLFVTHDLGVLSALTARSYVFYAGRVMESGPTTDLLLAPRHPYTAALLRARPHADATWSDARQRARGDSGGAAQTSAFAHAVKPARRITNLRTIPGSPVTPATAPAGCPFAPRCAYREDICAPDVPAMVEAAPGHALACAVQPNLRAEEVSA